MGKLDGKITIVTGATSGIGRRTAEIFVREGAKVVATGRREELGRSLEAALGKDNCVFIRTDATREADVEKMFDACISKWGRLDCLFNNAGGPSPVGGIETIDFIEAKNLSYNLGNVVKYITRADHKGNKLQDLQKAQWYLNREINKAQA